MNRPSTDHRPPVQPDAPQMARWLSSLLLTGGLFAMIAVVALPLPAATDGRGMAGVGTAALVAGGLVWLLRERLSPLAVNLLLPAVTLIVGFAVLFDGAAASPTTMFYVWVVLYAAYFLTPRQAALQLAAIGATHAGVLAAQGLDHTWLTRWAVVMITLTVAGAVVGHLVGRLRKALAVQGNALELRKKLTHQLAEAAHTDELTGLPNRRAWQQAFDYAIAQADREKAELCVAIVDVDHFKQFNDNHGHPAGDRLLRESAEAWRAQLRASDVIARYGGEEFAVLLPNCDATGAAELIERLRSATPPGQTVSAGLASWTGEEEPVRLMERADVALYQAKSRGRDRTVMAMEVPEQVA